MSVELLEKCARRKAFEGVSLQAGEFTMATVGALARIDIDNWDETCDQLGHVPGLSIIEVNTNGQIGLVLQGATLEQIHDFMAKVVVDIPGLLGCWPVYSSLDGSTSNEQLPN